MSQVFVLRGISKNDYDLFLQRKRVLRGRRALDFGAKILLHRVNTWLTNRVRSSHAVAVYLLPQLQENVMTILLLVLRNEFCSTVQS